MPFDRPTGYRLVVLTSLRYGQTCNPQSEIPNPLAVYLFNTICYHAGAMHQTGWAVAAVAQLGYGRGKSEH